jgi:hypothetical protein
VSEADWRKCRSCGGGADRRVKKEWARTQTDVEVAVPP